MRRLRGKLAPYLLSLPSWIYLAVFFIIPLGSMLGLATATGDPLSGYVPGLDFSNFSLGIIQYQAEFIRSFVYGTASTLITLIIAYPVAYWIAFHGGQHKSTFLFLLVLPFFVTFVIRVLAWEFILSDEGFVLGPLKSLGLIPQSAHILSTAWAVIGGLVYNSVAYYVLPLYVALEKIDRRVVRAANDLYASPRVAFTHVIIPLSAPGIFAGFLLVFVTNVGDFVNADLLGGTGTYMIGNVIQDSFFLNQDYPLAASLSSMLMFLLMVSIFLYARVFGTDTIQDYAA